MYMNIEQSRALYEARQRVPRYLFRAFSNGSRGGLIANNATHIHPDDSNWHYQASGDEAYTRLTLEEHLMWHTDHLSEFTSWTSSLLCALEHAMRKLHHWNEPEPGIYIAVLDTSNFAIPIWAATALYDAYGIQPRYVLDKSWWQLKRHYYLGEYLVRGGISSAETEFRVASLEQLRREGLHELLPELFDPRVGSASNQLACRIRDDRDTLWQPWSLKTLTSLEIKLCRQLGKCFAEEVRGCAFVFPVAVAFLSLRRWDVLFAPRHPARAVLESLILNNLQGLEIPDDLGGEEDFSGVSKSLRRHKPKEAIQFKRLCRRLINRSQGESTNDGEYDGQEQVQLPEDDVVARTFRLRIDSPPPST